MNDLERETRLLLHQALVDLYMWANLTTYGQDADLARRAEEWAAAVEQNSGSR